jgi:hypothetical protein
MTVPANEIDAGAQALRNRLQGGKKLTPWHEVPYSRKRKWLDYAACVLTAAASAKQIADVSK